MSETFKEFSRIDGTVSIEDILLKKSVYMDYFVCTPRRVESYSVTEKPFELGAEVDFSEPYILIDGKKVAHPLSAEDMKSLEEMAQKEAETPIEN